MFNTPEIEVTFEVDTNGILVLSAMYQRSGRAPGGGADGEGGVDDNHDDL